MRVFERRDSNGYWSSDKLAEIIGEVFNSDVEDKDTLEVMLCEKLKFVSEIGLDEPVGILVFSNRVFNILVNSGITTVGEFFRLTDEDFIKMTGFGRKALSEVAEKRKEFIVIE